MVYPPELLDRLQNFSAGPWEGIVFRHMLNDYPPDRANTRGARWNPPGIAALYASLSRETVIAEGQHRLDLEPFAPRVRRFIYRIQVQLHSALDLSSLEVLGQLDLTEEELRSDDFSACQLIGGAAAWLEHDGLLVPSVRSSGPNLVIFPAARDLVDFQILDKEEVS